MAKFKLIGTRYLRKYTEDATSPVYAAAIQAQTIVDELCDVPWEKVSASEGRMTYHTDEAIDSNGTSGLEANVGLRDSFDAALFCAGHVGGQHRAYANVACYCYKLPAAFIGQRLIALSARVTSDPYNSQGARLHVFSNSTGIIPTNCHELRGEDSSGQIIDDGTTLAAVAKRTVSTISGNDYWYPTTELVTLSPSGGIVLGQYLFLLVALESYSTVRGNWLEGCSFIKNLAEITTSSDVAGYEDGETIDLRGADAATVAIVSDGVVPDVVGDAGGVVAVNVLASGTSPVMADGGAVADIEQVRDELAPANIDAGVSMAYGALATGSAVAVSVSDAGAHRRRLGVGFCVKLGKDAPLVSPGGEVLHPDTISITASAFMVPFSVPHGMLPTRIAFDWSAWLEHNTPTAGTMFRFWIRRAAFVSEYPATLLRRIEMYDGTSAALDGWTLLGSAQASMGEATFNVSNFGERVATVLVTAFLPAGDIAEHSGYFAAGAGNCVYNALSPDSALGIARDYYAPYNFAFATHYVGDEVRLSVASPVGFALTGLTSSVSNLFADGQAVFATGDDGLWRTTDGSTWTHLISGAALSNFKKLGDNYFAWGDETALYRSTDGGETFVDAGFDEVSTGGRQDWVVDVQYWHGRYLLHSAESVFYWEEANQSWVYLFGTRDGNTGAFVIWLTRADSFLIAAQSEVWGFLRRSADGLTWEDVYQGRLGGSVDYSQLFYFAGKMIYTSQLVLYSVDGLTWSTGSGISSYVDAPLMTAGRCFVQNRPRGSSGTVYNGVMVSSDGITWTATNLAADAKLYAVGHIGQCYIAAMDGQGLLYSSDGITWTASNVTSGTARKIVVAGGMAVAMVNGASSADGGVYLSRNGFSWSRLEGLADDVVDVKLTCYGWLIATASGVYRGGDALNAEEGVYTCVERHESADWKADKWAAVDGAKRQRMTGTDTLCIPDITLIG